jgi:DNA polymerase I-like protein with 3'-5' exonuclease and polymerase domains
MMGDAVLAQNANIPVAEAQKNAEELFNTIKGVKQYIEDKSNYCINNNGKVDSVLGDVLDMSSEPADRWGRLGRVLLN